MGIKLIKKANEAENKIMEPMPFKKRMDAKRDNAQAGVVEKMREYIACRCASAFADAVQETYKDVGFTEAPELKAYDMAALFGTSNPQVIVADPQIDPLDDAEFRDLQIAIGSRWNINSVGLKIERPEPDVFEGHFLIPSDADKVIAVYKELLI